MKAVLNKGVTRSHAFAWYQQVKGRYETMPFNSGNFQWEDWAGDDGLNYQYGLVYSYMPSATTTSIKASSRAIYLYDSPGLNFSGSIMTAEEMFRGAIMDVQFRDFVRFKTTIDNGLIVISEAVSRLECLEQILFKRGRVNW